MVNYSAALGRLDFDGFDVPVLLHAGIDDDVLPHVGAVGPDDNILRHRRNKFRPTDVPYVVIEFRRWRHIGCISPGRTGVDPLHKRGDLVVGEPAVVLELVDADIGIDKPRWHHPRADPFLDGFGERPNFLVGL